MFISELFEPKAPTWKWVFRGSEEATADFKVGDVPYRFYAYSNGENDWEVEFKINSNEYDQNGKIKFGTKFGLAGTGNSAEVMSTVVDIMREFLEMYRGKIDTIGFTAEEPSRQKLYMRMMKRLLPDWTISTYDSGSGLGFTVVAPEELAEYKEHQLDESLSRVAYHFTNTHAALKILQSGNFELSSAPGSIEQQYMPPGKPYFMSTTRTLTGGYHSGGGFRKVMFNLDGNWFNQRYKSGPIDYWGNRGGNMRAAEAEDRVYSAEPTIPIDGVTAVHVFLNMTSNDEMAVNDRAIVRQLLIAAKARGIPAYFYNNHNAWLRQDTRNTADVGLLTGARSTGYYRGMRRRPYMQNWLELMGATAVSQLHPEADKLRYNLNYDYDRRAAAESLATDMSNARKPDSGPEREQAIKIIRYMRQHGLNTIPEFVDHIAAKWKDLR